MPFLLLCISDIHFRTFIKSTGALFYLKLFNVHSKGLKQCIFVQPIPLISGIRYLVNDCDHQRIHRQNLLIEAKIVRSLIL